MVAGWYTRDFCERVIMGFEQEIGWKPDFPFRPKKKHAVYAVKRALSGPADTEELLEAVDALKRDLIQKHMQFGYSRGHATKLAAAQATQKTEELRREVLLRKPDLVHAASEFRNKRQKAMPQTPRKSKINKANVDVYQISSKMDIPLIKRFELFLNINNGYLVQSCQT